MWNPFKKKPDLKKNCGFSDTVKKAFNELAKKHEDCCAPFEVLRITIERNPHIQGKINEYKISIEPVEEKV